MFRAVLPVVVDQAKGLSYPLAKAVGGKADRAGHGVHGGINSNSSNDDNGEFGDSDACTAAAVRNNRHRVGYSKPGVERNTQVAQRSVLR
jgi:hypothetical protein